MGVPLWEIVTDYKNGELIRFGESMTNTKGCHAPMTYILNVTVKFPIILQCRSWLRHRTLANSLQQCTQAVYVSNFVQLENHCDPSLEIPLRSRSASFFRDYDEIFNI